jgi:hypothetical protein
MKRVAAELALDTGHFEAIAWNKGTGVPCADCGQRFPPVVMDFDHRDGETKSGTISTKIGIWGWARILAEIAKCDIICANCHRIRTARRAVWPGAELVIDAADLSESA